MFVLLFCGISVFGEDKVHVIISIDLKSEIAMYERDYAVEQIKAKIPQLLRKHHIEEGLASIQFFSVEECAEDLDKYVANLNAPFSKFSNVNDILKSFNADVFNRFPGKFYSVITIAKPYSLLKYRHTEPDVLVEKTYLVLVTDYKYNGNDDFYGELKHVPKISRETKEIIMNSIKDVQQNYFYSFIAEEDISVYSRRGYISLFEVVPLQQYFAIESVLDFPHIIRASRTKDGYQASFSINQLNNPNYRLCSAMISLPNNKQELTQIINECGKEYMFYISKTIVDEVGKDGFYFDFKAWVQLIDNVYNHTKLSPDGTKLQGAEGLKRTIKVDFDENAKILGFIPLLDSLFAISFWTNDQNIAAAMWSWIIILIIIGIVIFFIWKSTQYKSKSNDVKI